MIRPGPEHRHPVSANVEPQFLHSVRFLYVASFLLANMAGPAQIIITAHIYAYAQIQQAAV